MHVSLSRAILTLARMAFMKGTLSWVDSIASNVVYYFGPKFKQLCIVFEGRSRGRFFSLIPM